MASLIRKLCTSIILSIATINNVSADTTPQRVVSINVCTDQLALLLAKPDQLYSVSFLASDPTASYLHEDAQKYIPNSGQAEELFRMQPDLILAGSYTTRATVQLLRNLGFRIEEFSPEHSITDIRNNIRRMGELLGTNAKASELIAQIDYDLQSLRNSNPTRLTLALYHPNSYTSGSDTLLGDIVSKAGLINLADKLSLSSIAKLPLEQLILSKPDLIVVGDSERTGDALAVQNFDHPAYKQLLDHSQPVTIDDRLTACGTPFTLKAAIELQNAALKLQKRLD